MADFIFTPAKGTLVHRWRKLSSDALSMWLIPVAVNGITDDALRNCGTMAEYLYSGPEELTTDGWGRREFTVSTLVDAQLDVDNQRVGLVMPEGLWQTVAVTAPVPTDLVVCHGPADAGTPDLVPLSQHDFTPVLTGGNVRMNFSYFHYAA